MNKYSPVDSFLDLLKEYYDLQNKKKKFEESVREAKYRIDLRQIDFEKACELEFSQKKEAIVKQADRQIHQLDLASVELSRLAKEIPYELIKKYGGNVSKKYYPEKPNFQEIQNAVSQLASIYTSSGLIGTLFNSSRTSYLVNYVMDAIGCGNAFVVTEKAKWTAYKQNEIEKLYDYYPEKLNRIKNNDNKYDDIKDFISSGLLKLNNEYKAFFEDSRLSKFDSTILDASQVLGASNNEWAKFSPSRVKPDSIMFGYAVIVDNSTDDQFRTALKNALPHVIMENSNAFLPMDIFFDSAVFSLIKYSESNREKVMRGLQSYILKLVRFVPENLLKIYYIDPYERGSNLGRLQKLSSEYEYKAINDVAASKEDIISTLKSVVSFVDDTTAAIAGYDNVYDYNLEHDKKIPSTYIFINDYPTNLRKR